MATSFEPTPAPEPTPLRPPGLEMARGLLYFSLVFMCFMFAQMATLIWRVIALTPDFSAQGFSLAMLDTTAFQERWVELSGNGNVIALVSLISGSVCLALLLFLLYRWKGSRMTFFLALNKPKLRPTLIWTGGVLVLFLALEGIARLFPDMDSAFMEKIIASATNYPLLFFGLGLAPAIFEEFLLRGLLYGSLRHMMDKHASIAITAGVFTLVHQQYDWYILLAYVLPLGIYLGYARTETGSIWVAVFLHLLNNCASMLLPQGN